MLLKVLSSKDCSKVCVRVRGLLICFLKHFIANILIGIDHLTDESNRQPLREVNSLFLLAVNDQVNEHFTLGERTFLFYIRVANLCFKVWL